MSKSYNSSSKCNDRTLKIDKDEEEEVEGEEEGEGVVVMERLVMLMMLSRALFTLVPDRDTLEIDTIENESEVTSQSCRVHHIMQSNAVHCSVVQGSAILLR